MANRRLLPDRITKQDATYRSWVRMKTRCFNKNDEHYPRYGGRGITICDRWRTFLNFLDDMGPRLPGTSIGRINNDGQYCPENCRWETAKEQASNRRTNRFITYRGETLTMAQWARRIGRPRQTIRNRLERGCSPEEIMVGKAA